MARRGIEVGSALRGGRPVAGLELEDTQISLETTQCGQFEADLLGIPNRSTLLLTVSLVHAGGRPFEDIVQLRLHDTRRPDDAEDEGQFMFVGAPAASPNGAR